MKKQIFAFVLAAVGITVLAGCPVYSDDGYRRVCDDNGCYSCQNDSYSNECDSWTCETQNDCPNGYSCQNYSCVGNSGYGTTATTDASTTAYCTAPGDCPNGETCGSNNECYEGTDCASVGCPSPYECEIISGSAQCVSAGTDAGPIVTVGGDDGGPVTSSGDGGVNSADAATDSGVLGIVPMCSSDTDCASAGASYKCLDGTCVAPANQCSDGTQCTNNESCVAGACTPACSTSVACPTGYACDTAKGVCDLNPTPCGSAADAGVCASGTTCVDQHCVTACNGAADASVCAVGDVCVGGGCIPDQKPLFVCDADGPGNGCTMGSTCLHHNCYIGCDVDAANSCATADRFNTCKPVTTSSGTYDVCGSSSNLGSECDPTTGKVCTTAGQVCIDGFCK